MKNNFYKAILHFCVIIYLLMLFALLALSFVWFKMT